MNSVALSIITATKDDPAGLARTLQSTRKWRTLSRVEQLVVDGSTDSGAARELVRKQEDSVKLIHEAPIGIAAAFNRGLHHACGDWIWFVNGGDAVHEDLDPDWLISLLVRTHAHVVTGSIHFDGEVSLRPLPHLSYQWPLILCWLAHPATLVRRDLLLGAGGFHEKWRIAMDFDLWQRLLRREVIVDAISAPFARFARDGVSEHSETRVQWRREEAKVVRKYTCRIVAEVFRLGFRVLRRLFRALCRR